MLDRAPIPDRHKRFRARRRAGIAVAAGGLRCRCRHSAPGGGGGRGDHLRGQVRGPTGGESGGEFRCGQVRTQLRTQVQARPCEGAVRVAARRGLKSAPRAKSRCPCGPTRCPRLGIGRDFAGLNRSGTNTVQRWATMTGAPDISARPLQPLEPMTRWRGRSTARAAFTISRGQASSK